MDIVSEFGEPDDLIYSWDLILLKLDQPWPLKRFPLDDCTLVNVKDRLYLRTNRRGLVCNRASLRTLAFSSAMFAGCGQFACQSRFACSARDILKRTDTLVVVHNMESVVSMATWFPSVRVLVLHHDLRLQFGELPRSSPRKYSRLRCVLGDSAAVGTDCLLLATGTLSNLSICCPQLSQVQAPVDKAAPRQIVQPMVHMFHPLNLANSREIILGHRVAMFDGSYVVNTGVNPSTVRCVSTMNPELERLELNTHSAAAVSMIARFVNLRCLSVMLEGSNGQVPNFDPLIVNLIEKFTLKELCVINFNNVRLSSIAQHCGKSIVNLSLLDCKIEGEEVAPNSFPILEKLMLKMYIDGRTLASLLSACPSLQSLHLGCTNACVLFLRNFSQGGRLETLQRLSFRLDLLFWEAGIDERDIKRLLRSLPSLRHLTTDSNQVRSIVRKWAPRINVTPMKCALCTHLFPRVKE